MLMNNTIYQLAYPILTQSDTVWIQTKTHKDLLLIQTVSPKTFNLFHIQEGVQVQILDRADENQLSQKITELCTVPSVTVDLGSFS